MVLRRGESSTGAEGRWEAALDGGHEVILRAISREKSRRDPGVLEYDTQQKTRVMLRSSDDTIFPFYLINQVFLTHHGSWSHRPPAI